MMYNKYSPTPGKDLHYTVKIIDKNTRSNNIDETFTVSGFIYDLEKSSGHTYVKTPYPHVMRIIDDNLHIYNSPIGYTSIAGIGDWIRFNLGSPSPGGEGFPSPQDELVGKIVSDHLHVFNLKINKPFVKTVPNFDLFQTTVISALTRIGAPKMPFNKGTFFQMKSQRATTSSPNSSFDYYYISDVDNNTKKYTVNLFNLNEKSLTMLALLGRFYLISPIGNP